jgi:hypothetical protein
MSKEEGFVARWSRKKSAERRLVAVEVPPESAEPAPMASPPTEPAAASCEAEAVEALPSLDSLTKDSDFAPFLRPGVPEDLKLAALRRLWTSDPVWAAPERLDIHNLDYTWPSIPEIVRTAYRVGQGFLEATEPLAEKAPVAATTRSVEEREDPPATERLGSEASLAPKEIENTLSDDTRIDENPQIGCNKRDENSV